MNRRINYLVWLQESQLQFSPPSPQRAPTSWASTLSSYCDGAYSMAIHILPIHRYILLVRYAVPQLLMGYYSVGMACSTATADMPFILLVLGMQYTATADMLLFCWYKACSILLLLICYYSAGIRHAVLLLLICFLFCWYKACSTATADMLLFCW